MPASSPHACLWCALLSVAVSLDLRVAYVTPNSLDYYSCVHDPPPCSMSALSDCSCEDMQLSVLHRVHLHSSPAFRLKQLTVWYTSSSSAARLLNNSVVKHLTLVHCGAGVSRGAGPPDALSQEGYFAVQHLERLTLVNLQREPALEEARNTELEEENRADQSTLIYNRVTDTNQGVNGEKREFLDLLPSQKQEVFMGREAGAAFREQARMGIIYSSVLDTGAEVKAYTVQTQISSNGQLPFPELHLPRLPEASTIYVSFVY